MGDGGGAVAQSANKSSSTGCCCWRSGGVEPLLSSLLLLQRSGDAYCFDDGACVPLVHAQGSVSVFLLCFCERVGVSSIPLGGWLV